MILKDKFTLVLILCLSVVLISCTSQVSEKDNNEISYDPPKIKRETNLGADLPHILHESEKQLIFSHYLGIFIYDLNSSEMIRAIKPWDPKLKIGAQGDTTSVVEVDKVDEIITIHNEGKELLDYYYVYDISKDKLTKHPIEDLPINIEQEQFTGQMNTSDWSAWDLTYKSELTGKTYYPYRAIID